MLGSVSVEQLTEVAGENGAVGQLLTPWEMSLAH